MSRQAHSLRYARLLSSLVGLLAVIIVMGACAISSQSGTTTGGSGGASTGPTATATIPGEADGGSTTGPTPTPTKKPPTPTKTATSTGGIICCITILPFPAVHQVLHQQTLTGTSVGPVTATCPTGEVALSGSWATSSSDGTNALVYNSTRNGAGGWNVYVQHSGSTLVNAYVMCLKNASGATVAERLGQITVNPNTYGTKFVSCNAGETLVGGGFASSNGVSLYNFTASGSSWGGYAWNHTGSALPFNFYAECLHYSGSHSSFTSSAQATGHTVSNACPSGSWVSGGGFAANSNSHVYTMSATSSGQAWEVYDTPASLLNAYAMCLAF